MFVSKSNKKKKKGPLFKKSSFSGQPSFEMKKHSRVVTAQNPNTLLNFEYIPFSRFVKLGIFILEHSVYAHNRHKTSIMSKLQVRSNFAFYRDTCKKMFVWKCFGLNKVK